MKIRAGGGALGQEGGALGQQGAPPCYSSLWETLVIMPYMYVSMATTLPQQLSEFLKNGQ